MHLLCVPACEAVDYNGLNYSMLPIPFKVESIDLSK